MNDFVIKSDIALSPGTIFAENFRLLENIGEGASGSVWRAENLYTSAQVCVKVLRSKNASAKNVQRFRRESQTLAKLEHTNIPQVHVFQAAADGTPFLVTEFVEGESLSSLLKREAPLPESRALPIFRQIAACLSYAHSQGVIHRDIKPSNIMIGKQDTVKVIDFGISRLLIPDETSQKLTQAGALIGSPAYMSPEQCLGREADARSDIYSLGCLMFEALTGFSAFAAENEFDTYNAHISAERKSLASRISNPAFSRVVHRCLQIAPEQRYQSAEELIQALEQIAPRAAARAKICKGARDTYRLKVLSNKPLVVFTAVVPMLLGAFVFFRFISSSMHPAQEPNSLVRMTMANEARERSHTQFKFQDSDLVTAYRRAYEASLNDHLLSDAQVLQCLETLIARQYSDGHYKESLVLCKNGIKLSLDNGRMDSRLTSFAFYLQLNSSMLHLDAQAIPDLEKIWKSYPDDDVAHKDFIACQLATSYMHVGRNKDALRLFEPMVQPGHNKDLIKDVRPIIAKIREELATQEKK